MERPKPTKQLLVEICGGNQGLISSAHHGLRESSLRDFYPNLDLDEAVAFAASSWKAREKDFNDFTSFLESAPVYELFSEMYKIGSPWLNKHKCISDKLKQKHQRLNPFRRKDLKARLSRVDPDDIIELRKKLNQPVSEYVFPCQYERRKRERGGDNFRLVPMHFQAAYPEKGKIVLPFASEVARIISKYPAAYELLPPQKQEPPVEEPKSAQGTLF